MGDADHSLETLAQRLFARSNMSQAIKTTRLTPAQLEELRHFTTCVTASAIETFGLRPFNTGFADASIRCQFTELPQVLGYAATARVRSANPPWSKHGYFYYDRTDW